MTIPGRVGGIPESGDPMLLSTCEAGTLQKKSRPVPPWMVRLALACLLTSAPACAEAVDDPASAHLDAEIAASDQERSADEAGYRAEYLPAQTRLLAARPGAWVCIAGGHLVHHDAARTFDTPSLADAAARIAAPKARHRFLFSIGSEGDLQQTLGMSGERYVVGMGWTTALGQQWMIGPRGFAFAPGQGKDFTPVAGYTCSAGTFVELDCRDLLDQRALSPLPAFQVSTGFNGTAVLPPSLARCLQLELWEIPGVAKVDGILQKGACRRAQVRMHITPTLERDFPVAIWPVEGFTTRLVSSGSAPVKPGA
jgi:hypothetical protein